MAAAIAVYGSSLRVLCFLLPREGETLIGLHELLEVRGSQLQSLEIWGEPSTEYCHLLNIVATNCINLKELTFGFGNAMMPPLFWQRVGAKLRKLSFWEIGLLVSSAHEIQMHCRELRTINLQWPLNIIDTETSDTITELLQSYGEQLENAIIEMLPPESCKLIAVACPNAKLSTTLGLNTYSHRGLAKLHALGENLSHCNFHHDALNLFDSRDIIEAISACSRLTSASIRWAGTSNLDCFRALLSAPMYNIRVLSLYYDYDDTPSAVYNEEDMCNGILNIVANKFQDLEQFSINGFIVAQGALKRIGDRNVNLQHLRITLPDLDDLSSTAVDLLNSFTLCKYLSYFEVQYASPTIEEESVRDGRLDWGSIATACIPYRRRGLYVQIFNRIFK